MTITDKFKKIGYKDDAGDASVCFESMTIYWSGLDITERIRRYIKDDKIEWDSLDDHHNDAYIPDLSAALEKAYLNYLTENILLAAPL